MDVVPGPLTGIRVLDFTERMQGPYATQMLADMGADVVKVERRVAITADGRADDRYGVSGSYGTDAADSTIYSAGFLANNRNKRSVTVDVKMAAGRSIIERLMAGSDVVYENFRPGVMDRLGLGYERCRELNPAVVYVSATGYGPVGPHADKPGQDVLVEARTGWGHLNSVDGHPVPVATAVADTLGAMNGAFGTVCAIVHAVRTGRGQRVRTSLYESAIAGMAEWGFHFLNSPAGAPRRPRSGHASPYTPPPYGFYSTADGHLALSSGRKLDVLSSVLGIPNLADDKRFSTHWSRIENEEAFTSVIETALGTKTTAEWVILMEAEDLFAAPVNSMGEAFADSAVVATSMVVELETPAGPLKFLGVPYKLDETPASIRTPPPLHGQHTDEVLSEAGFSEAEIAEFRRKAAI
ncbi:CaiB/BaiF CoA transferase family protein [Mycolicibacterium tokaiense]|uniref:Recemase n=1 Tax=Mycolicibacterium tokaiense TaxID=39695 RepID=A0A378TEI2_9MYCO|nr:CoA transferase [Mycolicibacterium tokaiense]BBY86333.1 CoA transferase [Mycolicibacterium tokaiense]STZ59159.1 recemase [Mycolicibacterium tokaiense]